MRLPLITYGITLEGEKVQVLYSGFDQAKARAAFDQAGPEFQAVAILPKMLPLSVRYPAKAKAAAAAVAATLLTPFSPGKISKPKNKKSEQPALAAA